MINLNKNFLIYGYGVSGKSVSKYLSNKNCKYSIFDDFKKLTKVKNVISKVILKEKLKFFDYIVISPSIKIDKKHIHNFIDSLSVSESIKIELKDITPENFTGIH